MRRISGQEQIIAEIKLEDCPDGPVLQPLEYNDESRQYFKGWETPLAPWGGFGLNSGLTVIKDNSTKALEWVYDNADRAIVSGSSDLRNYKVTAEIKPIDTSALPNDDRTDCSKALIGIVFRIHTSRHYYQFGIEGRRKAVLYHRADDKWTLLAEQDVFLPNEYITLEVDLDGDGIYCTCEELGVELFCTDTAYREGKAGLRAIGKARASLLKIAQTELHRSLHLYKQTFRQEEELYREENIPEPKLKMVLDHSKLGGSPKFNDFHTPDRYDMIIAGKKLKAMTLDGKTLWETPIKVDGIVFSAEHTDNGKLIYGFTGERNVREIKGITGSVGRSVVSDEMVVIRGSDGVVLARAKLPNLDREVQITAFTTTSGNLSGSGAFDIVLREWRTDCGNGGFNLWAYDQELNLLWDNKVNAPYGHGYAVQFFDVDGDGRDEFLAGGTLFTHDGKVFWIHDLEHEMSEIPGAHHYDAVAIGNFADDPTTEEAGPVAFLLGGSAGVYVVDGLTGETRMIHRVGHAQGRLIGKVRKDIPGQQILVACRWGNMGILTLFSGYGGKLWTIQPDYLGQGSCPITWGDPDEQLIWMNTSAEVQSLYNGHGQRVKVLNQLRDLWGNRMRRDVATSVLRMGDDPTELICLTLDGKTYAFGPK